MQVASTNLLGLDFDFFAGGSQKVTWPEFYESVAKLFAGRRCAMHAPATQVACYGSPEEVGRMVHEFKEATLPHTTAVVMPGCEIDSYHMPRWKTSKR